MMDSLEIIAFYDLEFGLSCKLAQISSERLQDHWSSGLEKAKTMENTKS